MSVGVSEATSAAETAVDFSGSQSVAGSGGSVRGRFDGKRCFDFHVALALIVLLVPLIATVALALLLIQGRPVLIRHRRVGRGGALFPCFKFRTMVRNADKVLESVLDRDPGLRREWEETRKLQHDPRITAFGRVLRETSVDEVPQLFNILRGHMSFVGPRPIVTDEIPLYGVNIQHYYRVRPGLTGAWQVGGRSDVSFARRVDLDTSYVATRTFRTDMVILAKTVPAVVKRQGSR
jgi:exopolysaccharide production protein ExoY